MLGGGAEAGSMMVFESLILLMRCGECFVGGFYRNSIQTGRKECCGTRWMMRHSVTALALSPEASHPSLNLCDKRFLMPRT